MSTDSKKAYQEYLKTDTWKTIRAQRLAMDNGECVLCGDKAEHVHHKRYPKKWGTETIKDLSALCEDCHSKFHKKDARKSITEIVIPEDDTECHHIYNERTDESKSVYDVHDLWDLANALDTYIMSQHTEDFNYSLCKIGKSIRSLESRIRLLEKSNG